jgi:hypothetical protein
MDAIYHWAGVALAFLFIGWAFVGFWRGLSLRPTEPETRPKGWTPFGGTGRRAARPLS